MPVHRKFNFQKGLLFFPSVGKIYFCSLTGNQWNLFPEITVSVRRDLRGSVYPALDLWKSQNFMYKPRKFFHSPVRGRMWSFQKLIHLIYTILIMMLGLPGHFIAPEFHQQVIESKGCALSRKPEAFYFPHHIHSAKFLYPDQVQVIQDMQISRGSSAYWGALDLNG
jgi:hypothetical protein